MKQLYETEIEIVCNIVCDYFNIQRNDLFTMSRDSMYVLPRQVIYKILKDIYENKISLSVQGWVVGHKDHCTVIHSRKKVSNFIETDKRFAKIYNELLNTCKNELKIIDIVELEKQEKLKKLERIENILVFYKEDIINVYEAKTLITEIYN